jgi:sugar lactone lactonase YvrE
MPTTTRSTAARAILSLLVCLMLAACMPSNHTSPAATGASPNELEPRSGKPASSPAPLATPMTPPSAPDQPVQPTVVLVPGGAGTVSPTRVPARVEVLRVFDGAPDRWYLPIAVALDRQGRLYVVEAGAGRLHVLSPDGQPLARWGSEGGDAGQFRFRATDRCDDLGQCRPVAGGGVAVDGDGRVYVADFANHRIQTFDGTGRLLGTWGRAGFGPGEFQFPAGIAVDGYGQVYVSDLENHRIQRFDRAGRFLGQLGERGFAPGRLYRPSALTVDGGGRVWVVEPHGNRVQHFDDTGRFLGAWTVAGLLGQAQDVSGIAVDGQGHVFVSGPTSQVRKFTPDGEMVATWGLGRPGDVPIQRAAGLVIAEHGDLYVVDRDAGQVLLLRHLVPVTG